MSIDTTATAEEDMKVVTEAVLAGRPVPSDVADRVEERAAEFRQRILREHGFLDISVPYTRESREAGH